MFLIVDREEFCRIQTHFLTQQHAKHCRMLKPMGNLLAVSVQRIIVPVLFVL